MGGPEAFYQVLILAGLYGLSGQYFETECVRPPVGIPNADPIGVSAEPDPEYGHQEKDTIGAVSSQLRICHRTLRYREDLTFRDRSSESFDGNRD